MTRRPLLWIVALLLLAELVHRLAFTALCYVDLRYSPFLIGRTDLWQECVGRHLLFPFRL